MCVFFVFFFFGGGVYIALVIILITAFDLACWLRQSPALHPHVGLHSCFFDAHLHAVVLHFNLQPDVINSMQEEVYSTSPQGDGNNQDAGSCSGG